MWHNLSIKSLLICRITTPILDHPILCHCSRKRYFCHLKLFLSSLLNSNLHLEHILSFHSISSLQLGQSFDVSIFSHKSKNKGKDCNNSNPMIPSYAIVSELDYCEKHYQYQKKRQPFHHCKFPYLEAVKECRLHE